MAIVIMPKQGLQMTEGVITRWLKCEGDPVREGEPLFEMETDKLAITIDASDSGTLIRILHPAGDTVPVAEPIAEIGKLEEAKGSFILSPLSASSIAVVPDVPALVEFTSPQEVPAPTEVPVQPKESHPMTAPIVDSGLSKTSAGLHFATPRAKLRAQERGLDLKGIPGTGPDGLVIERDVLAFRQPATPVFETLAVHAALVDMAEAKGMLEQFAMHHFAYGVVDLLERAAARTSEQLGVILTSTVSQADLSIASFPDTLTLGAIGPSETAWLTLTDAGDAEKSIQALRRVQFFLEHPPFLL